MTDRTVKGIRDGSKPNIHTISEMLNAKGLLKEVVEKGFAPAHHIYAGKYDTSYLVKIWSICLDHGWVIRKHDGRIIPTEVGMGIYAQLPTNKK